MRHDIFTEEWLEGVNKKIGKVGGGVGRATRTSTAIDERKPRRDIRGCSVPEGLSVAGANPAPPPIKREYRSKLPRELVIVGQMPSGKTSGVKEGYTKTGKKYRYPNARFKAWRELAVGDLLKQWKDVPVTEPVRLYCQYWPGDRRTRDVPGIEDAMLHALVKAGVLKDDGLAYDILWYRQPMNRKGAKVLITVQEWGP